MYTARFLSVSKEACFYECEPNAGLFRMYNESEKGNPDFNTWQLEKMPIKKSYCDAWYTACYEDFFCGKGDFWECDAHYWSKQAALEEELLKTSSGSDGVNLPLVVAGTLAGVLLIAALFLVYREKKGKPVFDSTLSSSAEAAEVS
jgi:folate receptor